MAGSGTSRAVRLAQLPFSLVDPDVCTVLKAQGLCEDDILPFPDSGQIDPLAMLSSPQRRARPRSTADANVQLARERMAMAEGRRVRLVEEVAGAVAQLKASRARGESRNSSSSNSNTTTNGDKGSGAFERIEALEARRYAQWTRAARTHLTAMERAMNDELAMLRGKRERLVKEVEDKTRAVVALRSGVPTKHDKIRAEVSRRNEASAARFAERAAAAAARAAEQKAALERAIVAKEASVAERLVAVSEAKAARLEEAAAARAASLQATRERALAAEKGRAEALRARLQAKDAKIAAIARRKKQSDQARARASPVIAKIRERAAAAEEMELHEQEKKITKLLLKEQKRRRVLRKREDERAAYVKALAGRTSLRRELVAANRVRKARSDAARRAELERKMKVKGHKFDAMTYRLQESKFNLLAVREAVGDEEAALRAAFEAERDALLGDIEVTEERLRDVTHHHLVALGVRSDPLAASSRPLNVSDSIRASHLATDSGMDVGLALHNIQRKADAARSLHRRARTRRGLPTSPATPSSRARPQQQHARGSASLPEHLFLASGPMIPRPPTPPEYTPGRPHYVSPIRVPRAKPSVAS